MNIEVLRFAYFASFQSLLEYGIILWGHSPHIGHTFSLQKIIIRIMVGVISRCSCRSLFRKPDILTLSCLCIYLLMIYVANNIDTCHMNTSIHRIDTSTKMSCTGLWQSCQGVFYSGIKIVNSLALAILACKNKKSQFKTSLRPFL